MKFLEQADYIGYVIEQLSKYVKIKRLPFIPGFSLEVPSLAKNFSYPCYQEKFSSPHSKLVPPLNLYSSLQRFTPLTK